ncbi:MAG: RdgB/HAM1 family non-canonical purine NTP pyrophosphatase [Akkermansiaceae bacterium]|nr:RdgB/HAM1 family non-canonical purine NTP pyrophosphatase [Akkermansiaceae bacterium]
MSEDQLLIATRNRHKTEEITDFLGKSIRVDDLSSFPEAPEIEETGATFAENSILKAVGISRVVKGLVLADDSGLEVDALNGCPGVYSARYAGPEADDGANNRKLIAALAGVPRDARTGRFRCVMAMAREGRVLAQFDGTVEGHLLEEPRGEAGFGYDPLFVPEGYEQSFAELGAEVKNHLSHRARALAQVMTWLAEQ